jgi:hypothetical protein
MSLNHILNSSSASKIEIKVERIISTQVETDQIVPILGGEVCVSDQCVTGNLTVEADDSSRLNFKTPNVGTAGQFLTSKGDGSVEFTTQTPPDLTPIEGKIQNITATAGVTDIVGTTNTETLTVQADDASVISLKPANLGIAGQVLKTDAVGGVYWGSDEFNPSGLEYTGPGTDAINKIVRFNSNDGLSAVEASFTDTPLGPQFNELNINNIDNVQCKSISKLGTDANALSINSTTYGIELNGGDGTVSATPTETIVDHASGATTVSAKTQVFTIVDSDIKSNVTNVSTVIGNNNVEIVGDNTLTLGTTSGIFLEKLDGQPLQIASEVNMLTNKITNVVDGVLPQDAVTKFQLDGVSGDADGRLDTLEQKTSTLFVSTFGGGQTQIVDNNQIAHKIGLANKLTHSATNSSIQNSNCSMDAISGDAFVTATGGVTLTAPTTTINSSSTKINGNKMSIDDQKGDDILVSYLGGVNTSINGNSSTSSTGDYAVGGGANTLQLNAIAQEAVLRGETTVQLKQGVSDVITGTAVDTTVNNLATVNLSTADVPRLIVTGTETTSTLPVLMSGQRIQNLGNATGAGADAMNRTSVEAITDALDTRLTNEEGKVLDLEQKTSTLSVVTTGTPGDKCTMIDAIAPADAVCIRVEAVEKIKVRGGTVSIDDSNILMTGLNQINLNCPSITLQGGDITLVGAVDVNNNQISNCLDPTLDQDVATKAYVDANAGGGGGGVATTNFLAVPPFAGSFTPDTLSSKMYWMGIGSTNTFSWEIYLTNVSTASEVGGNFIRFLYEFTGGGWPQFTTSFANTTQVSVFDGVTGNAIQQLPLVGATIKFNSNSPGAMRGTFILQFENPLVNHPGFTLNGTAMTLNL